MKIHELTDSLNVYLWETILGMWRWQWNLVFKICFRSWICILNVSKGPWIQFCIYEHIWKYVLPYSEGVESGKVMILRWLWIQASVFWNLLFFSYRRPQTMGKMLEISTARQKCLCVSGKLVLWSKHFDIKVLVAISYLKLWNYMYCLSHRRRGATEGPLETTSDHKGQFPRTDSGAVTESSPQTTPPGPLTLCVFGDLKDTIK